MQKIVTTLALMLGLAFTVIGCEEDSDNKMAQAQECFDQLGDSASNAQALACEEKMDGVTTAQSYVLRCAIRFFVGGVKTAEILAAYEAMEDANENDKAAILMANMSQDSEALALTTYDNCLKSEVSSLNFVATTSLIGTIMTEAATSTDPATFLAYCESNGCNDAVVGDAVVTMYDSYCIGDAATNSVCMDINNAITAGGGDAETIANLLYQYLQ